MVSVRRVLKTPFTTTKPIDGFADAGCLRPPQLLRPLDKARNSLADDLSSPTLYRSWCSSLAHMIAAGQKT